MNKYQILLLLIIFSSATHSQNIVRFKDCVQMAFENNLTLKNQHLTESISRNNLMGAEYKRLPTANAFTNGQASWGRGIDPYTNTYANQQFNTYNGGANFNWTLFNGFYNINNIKFQKYDLESNKSTLQKMKNDISIDIATKYTNILYYKALIHSVENQLEISQQNIQFINEKIKSGSLAKNDIYKSLAQRDLEESNLIQAKNQLEINWIDLKQLMNIAIDSPLEIADKSIQIDSTSIALLDRNQIKEQALKSYPSIVLAKTNIQKSKISLEMAKAAFYPTISWGGNIGSTYSTFNRFFSFKSQVENNLSYSTSLSANFPLFNQYQTKTKVKEAQFNIEKSELNTHIEAQKVERMILLSYNNLKASEKKCRATRSALNSNEISYKNDKIKYELGKINAQELNLSKSNYFNANANYIKDKYELLFNYYTLLMYQGTELDF